MKKIFTVFGVTFALLIITACPNSTVPVDTPTVPVGDSTVQDNKVIDISAISGIIPPFVAYLQAQPPVTLITETEQYNGTVSWSPADNLFGAETVYTATITLTPKTGYTLTGVKANFFTVSGATTVTNVVDSGIVTAVFSAIYIADGVDFNMVYVPGGMTFPTGTNDDSIATVTNSYLICETEVTYELWEKVYSWATSGNGATGAGQYTFANVGRAGGGVAGSQDNHEPVTTVNWHDSIVWCNALTEWYNAQKNTNYECVYVYQDAIIRDSRDTNATACDNAIARTTANGFRLLTSNEYELAARYRDGKNWTYGDHASGDNTGACYDDGSILGGQGMSTILDNYAVYSDNSGYTTDVYNKSPNALRLFHMSGNVSEWCFDLYQSSRVLRGGSFRNTAFYLRVGYWIQLSADYEYWTIGFRIARTQ